MGTAKMTAITLNLLVEEQRAHEARAHDPVKTCVAIGVGLLMITAVIGSVAGVRASSRKAEASQLQRQHDQLVASRQNGAATGFKALKSQMETIVVLNEGRVVFAPQLAMIKDVVPESIELTRLELKINAELQQGGVDEKGRARANRNVERPSLKLEGRATSVRPELAVDMFINALGEKSELREMIDKVQLRSIASVPLREFEKETRGSAVSFVIEATYK
jgi:hypothetical protein